GARPVRPAGHVEVVLADVDRHLLPAARLELLQQRLDVGRRESHRDSSYLSDRETSYVVRVRTAEAEEGPMTLDGPPPDGTINFRDLGGLPAAGGRVTRPGRLFRSGSLGEVTPSGLGRLHGEIGIAFVVDLRGAEE